MCWLKCPVCGETREYDSDDMNPSGWDRCEEMSFECKACGRELDLAIDYQFEFFDNLDIDPRTEEAVDVMRYSIQEAKDLYHRQNAPKRPSLGGGTGFSLSPPGKFSLSPPSGFSLASKRRKR